MKRTVFLLLLSSALLLACSAKPVRYSLRVKAEYPHDSKAYTQGLFWHDGTLYESTGLNGHSSIRTVDLNSGKPVKTVSFSRKYFAEGSTAIGDRLYLLTWQEHVAFIYDVNTLKYIQTYSYPREGWGLTTDGKSLIASDGSSRIYFLSTGFKLERTIDVKADGRPISRLNELEYIDGKIWANIYTTNTIAIINPKDGTVEAFVDCTGLLPDRLRTPDTDVLNGIAHNPADGRIYLTGKNWKRLYEVELVK